MPKVEHQHALRPIEKPGHIRNKVWKQHDEWLKVMHEGSFNPTRTLLSKHQRRQHISADH